MHFYHQTLARCQERYVNVRPVYLCVGEIPTQRLDNRPGKITLLGLVALVFKKGYVPYEHRAKSTSLTLCFPLNALSILVGLL